MSAVNTERAAYDAKDDGLRRKLTVAWVAAFYSNAPIYLTLFLVPAIRPMHWMYVFSPFFLWLWIQPRFWWQKFSVGLPAWIAGYAVICMIWFASFGGGDPEVLRQRLVALAFLLATLTVIGGSAGAIRAARKTIMSIVVIAVLINVYDISHPYVMIPAESEFATLGRAAGLYGNPNQAGAALVMGFILTLGLVPSRWRAAYLAYVGIGIVLTLSRGAMLGFALVVCALWIKSMLTMRQVLAAALVGGIAGWVVATVLLPMLTQQFNLDPTIVVDRLLWIVSPEARADFSQMERAYLADRGWQQFLSAPALGNGIGSTELWEARASTHNVYLMLLSDFGIIGALVFPALVLASIRGNGAADVRERWAFALFVLMWGALSHNVLSEYYFLICFATMAAWCSNPPHADSNPWSEVRPSWK